MVSKICIFSLIECVSATQGHPRSTILVPIDKRTDGRIYYRPLAIGLVERYRRSASGGSSGRNRTLLYFSYENTSGSSIFYFSVRNCDELIIMSIFLQTIDAGAKIEPGQNDTFATFCPLPVVPKVRYRGIFPAVPGESAPVASEANDGSVRKQASSSHSISRVS